MFHLIYSLLISQFAIHETATTRLLHHLGSVVARDFAKTFAAIHNGIVDDLGIGKEETAVGCASKLVRLVSVRWGNIRLINTVG